MRELTTTDHSQIDDAIQNCLGGNMHNGDIVADVELALDGGLIAFIGIVGTYITYSYSDSPDEIESNIQANVELRDEEENSLWLPIINRESSHFC